MDALGERLIRDEAAIKEKRDAADFYERKAQQLRREADELERLKELARCA